MDEVFKFSKDPNKQLLRIPASEDVARFYDPDTSNVIMELPFDAREFVEALRWAVFTLPTCGYHIRNSRINTLKSALMGKLIDG